MLKEVELRFHKIRAKSALLFLSEMSILESKNKEKLEAEQMRCHRPTADCM
jgi:hypothetical protein